MYASMQLYILRTTYHVILNTYRFLIFLMNFDVKKNYQTLQPIV